MPTSAMSARRAVTGHRWLSSVAAGLSAVAATVYLIIASGLAPDDLASPPRVVMLVAGVSYLVGGALILRRNHRLLLLGAILNPLVIVAFIVSLAAGNTELEILGVISKLAQLGLEVALLMLIRDSRHSAAR